MISGSVNLLGERGTEKFLSPIFSYRPTNLSKNVETVEGRYREVKV